MVRDVQPRMLEGMKRVNIQSCVEMADLAAHSSADFFEF
jgi:hypothetical protein